MKFKTLITLLVLLLLSGQAYAKGITGQEAPHWGVAQWKNLPSDVETLDISDLKGKVVFLYGFQSWCPGCHKHGFPTLKKLVQRFEGNDDIAFVAVQTVFEGFSTNNADLEALFAEHGEVTSARVITDRDTGRSRGFGFVEMPSADEANAAIRSLNGHNVDGRDLKVNQARERS